MKNNPNKFTDKQYEELTDLDNIMKHHRSRYNELNEMYGWINEGYKDTDTKEEVMVMIFERAQIYNDAAHKAYDRVCALRKKWGK